MVNYYVIEELEKDEEWLYYMRYNWLNYCHQTYFSYLPKDIINIIIDYIPISLQLYDIILYELCGKKHYFRLVYKLNASRRLMMMRLDNAKQLKNYPKIDIITSNGLIYFDIIKDTIMWETPIVFITLNDKYKYCSSIIIYNKK